MRHGRFRKLPVEIEAVRVSDVLDALTTPSRNFGTWPSWLASAYNAGKVGAGRDCLSVETDGHGIVRADREDWIIRGVNGELYPCRPDVFAKTYEEI